MKLRRKLGSHRGETLVETLAAILVVSLSSALFLTLISTGVRISTAGDDKMQKLDAQLTTAEETEAGTGDPGTITLTPEHGSTEKIAVDFYGESDHLRSYRLAGGGGSP